MVWKKQINIGALAIALAFTSCQDAGNEGREPIQPPTADFTSKNTNCRAPCKVDFNSFVNNTDGYFWAFGDGDTSSKANPSHIYEEAGTYSVSLRVGNVSGSDAIVKQITIDSGYTNAAVASVTLNDFPATDTNNTMWDPNSPPDLYVEFLQNPDSLLITNTQVFPNMVDSLTLPKTWDFAAPQVVLTDFEQSYAVRVLDQDNNMPDDTLLTYTLPQDALRTAPDPYPETVPIRNTDDETIGNIAFDWFN